MNGGGAGEGEFSGGGGGDDVFLAGFEGWDELGGSQVNRDAAKRTRRGKHGCVVERGCLPVHQRVGRR